MDFLTVIIGKEPICLTASFYGPRSKSSRGNRQQKGYSSTTGRTEVEAETESLTEQHCLFSKCIGMCILVYMCTVTIKTTSDGQLQI